MVFLYLYNIFNYFVVFFLKYIIFGNIWKSFFYVRFFLKKEKKLILVVLFFFGYFNRNILV